MYEVFTSKDNMAYMLVNSDSNLDGGPPLLGAMREATISTHKFFLL